MIDYEPVHADRGQCEQPLHEFAKSKRAAVTHREIGQLVSIEDNGWQYYFQCVDVDFAELP